MDKTKALLALLILLTMGLVAGVIAWGIWGDGPTPEATAGSTAHSEAVAATTPGETDRERIATSHAKERHQIRMRFGCETLKTNIAGVWGHLKLRVRISDENDVYLAECTRPERPATLSIPIDVTRIAITAPGYKRKVMPTPRPFKPGMKPTTVLLEPDALVRVRLRNPDSTAGGGLACGARLATSVDDQGLPILESRVAYRPPTQDTPGGTLLWEFKIPSGVAALFDVARAGTAAPEDGSGFAGVQSEVVTLAPGEQRDILLDLGDSHTLEGQVTGVAARALAGQVLSLEILGESKRRGGSPIVLDASGCFRITGLAHQQVGLRLLTQGGESPALREVGSGRRQWSAADAGFVVVEPEVLLHGVVPAKGGTILERPFLVQTGGAPDSDSPLGRRIPLFTREKLAQAPLFFLVDGFGHFQRSLQGQLPDADGLYRVEVPVPGGSLQVLVENQPKQGVFLFAAPVDGSGAIAGTPTDNNWRFEGLAPGNYQVLMSYNAQDHKGHYVHSGRLLAKTVAVRSQQETRVTVRMPELVEIPGQVTNWSEARSSLRPEWLRLHHGGERHSARIDSRGRFRFAVLGPWDGARELTFYGGGLTAEIKTTDVSWLAGGGELLVTFPGIRTRWLLAQAVAGGRQWAHVYPIGARGGQMARASDGRILVQDLPAGVEGVWCEQVQRSRQQTRILRGWFRLTPGGATETRLSFRGRFVQVAMAKADQAATLTLEPPAWWQHPPLAWANLRLTGTRPQQLWLPADAVAVVVNGSREIPAGTIGDKLVID